MSGVKCGHAAPRPAAGMLRLAQDGLAEGWLAPDPEAPREPPEVALGIGSLWAEAVEAEAAPDGRWVFRWRVPPSLSVRGLSEGASHALRAWHLGTGQELEGSPLRLPVLLPAQPGPDGPAPEAMAAALSRWPAGLSGRLGAAAPRELAEGLWVQGGGGAASLRFEMIRRGVADAARRGVRLQAESGAGAISVHLRADVLATADGPRRLLIAAWLTQATEAFTQESAELWLSARSGRSFVPVRLLRRFQLFRSPAAVEAMVEPQALGEGGLPWLTLSVAEARGLVVMPPVLAPPPAEGRRMEDGRLEQGFAALADAFRIHRRVGASDEGLLPPMPSAVPVPRSLPAEPIGVEHPVTEVVVPVFNGGVVVRDCLRALRAAMTGPCRVLVVDDGSRPHTHALLREETAGDPLFRLHRRDVNRGYTRSINEGVLATEAPWVVILNSDTVVTPGWLDRLHAAARARPGTGMVGPLSNAASWQSIPEVKRADGGWSTNDAITVADAGRVQALVGSLSERARPEFPLLNGFATLIAREVFDRVGLYDEEAFPMGYGEETDLCLRARRAGFGLVVADDCFVFHHKSVSFGASRQGLSRAGNLELANKHPGLNTAALEAGMQRCAPLARLRALLAERLAAPEWTMERG